MRVRYVEGLANRSGPESCAVTLEGDGEALTGVRTGQPLSLERSIVSGADMVTNMEGNTDGRVIARLRAPERPGVVVDTGMCGRSLHGNREILESSIKSGVRGRETAPSSLSMRVFLITVLGYIAPRTGEHDGKQVVSPPDFVLLSCYERAFHRSAPGFA